MSERAELRRAALIAIANCVSWVRALPMGNWDDYNEVADYNKQCWDNLFNYLDELAPNLGRVVKTSIGEDMLTQLNNYDQSTLRRLSGAFMNVANKGGDYSGTYLHSLSR
jgi:hypothetical protein